MLAIAEMYVQGVSTRDVAKVMAEFGLKSLSSTQVSRAAALLNEELAAWRRRPLGEIHYLLLDAAIAVEIESRGIEEHQVEVVEQVAPLGKQPLLDQVLGAARRPGRIFLRNSC